MLKNSVQKKLNGSAFLFSAGRESLLALFRAMNVRAGEEIIVQGYTCAIIPNAIHAAGGVPVYVDIDRDTLNLDCDAVEQRITPRTRAVICQHTFGIPADFARLRAICDAKKILLIEDLAHVIPDDKGPPIGHVGDVALLSFGRDKAASGITGSALVVRKSDLCASLASYEKNADRLSTLTIVQLLNYPQAYAIARPFMGIKIGFAFLKLLRSMKLLSPVLTEDEKNGIMTPVLHRLPNVCAYLVAREIDNLACINDHRRSLTALYLDAAKKHGWDYPQSITEALPLQKFPIFVEGAPRVRAELKKKNIHLDDGWTGCVVCPASANLTNAGYAPGSDPEAENASTMILNLPTHPTMSHAQALRLIDCLVNLLPSRA
jgi:dTDP-4-amino-4,6-dideoxygalactose transaminase